jgi:hypothetical protein
LRGIERMPKLPFNLIETASTASNLTPSPIEPSANLADKTRLVAPGGQPLAPIENNAPAPPPRGGAGPSKSSSLQPLQGDEGIEHKCGHSDEGNAIVNETHDVGTHANGVFDGGTSITEKSTGLDHQTDRNFGATVDSL